MWRTITVVLLIGLLAWAYQATQPPPPQICGTPGGPPVTAPRIKLRDGRHLAYKEHGVLKEIAKHKIVYVHGFDSCRHDAVIATNLSLELVKGLGVYIVSFDRPGYGESDPDPKRTVKSLALDIEELADKLGLGDKFYLTGFSMGGQVGWGCLKYIPHRLAGAMLLAPSVNYWWPGLPSNLSTETYYKKLPQDQWTFRVAHYIPWLIYWWNTQKWFPASSTVARKANIFSSQDLRLLPKFASKEPYRPQIKQQGDYESIHRDMIIGFGNWEFDPLDLDNPFPNNEGSVHLWQGDDDRLVPVLVQRYIAEKLPWIQYHELPGAGHLFPVADGMSDAIVKTLLFGEK
ncbi:Alpha/beta-Hydrolases superfamily protein [Quillaja saponaria]|uniref:Alpha/beta-Hydrolases superfamily protein n=1 Tax=Quillaja saponaria TaxID=32244 RepID=A0AAD7PWV9_QUISA|nr:Alpha/beta-Hydrolases superfamily protein [Quillaja saponaria]